MEVNGQGRSARKHQAIMEAATGAFMEKGYSGTSMDDIARRAAMSKQTVYKRFADKEKPFAEIVLATTDRIDGMIDPVADHFSGLLLGIPVNKAVLHGGPRYTDAELDRCAAAGVRAFLAAYR
ncbi:TetR/AcrR family transcriptional regulator [Streptomyces sp. NPDC001732]